MDKKADIGLIGLAVMGQNLVLNMDDHDFNVAVYNRTTSKMTDFVAGPASDTNVEGFEELEDMVAALEKPRRVMLMVKAGSAVDKVIEQLLPMLDEGDIIIDGGNANHHDSIRHAEELEEKGLRYIGTGISGGEEGARNGPSIMPGGTTGALGSTSRTSSRVSPRKSTTCPAATGSARTAQVTSSRWYITASSMATCSSSARRIT